MQSVQNSILLLNIVTGFSYGSGQLVHMNTRVNLSLSLPKYYAIKP